MEWRIVLPLVLILLVGLLYVLFGLELQPYTISLIPNSVNSVVKSYLCVNNNTDDEPQFKAEGLKQADHKDITEDDLRFISRNDSKKAYDNIKEDFYATDRIRMDVMDAWSEIAHKANISWWIDCGTLLGSYRHWQMIPWDHDYDTCVDRKDRNRTVAAFEQHLNKTLFWFKTNERWLKLYTYSSKAELHGVPRKNYKWPFLDIFWMDINETHVWAPTQDMYHRRKTIFPLTTRPFFGRDYPSPRDPREALNEMYGNGKIGGLSPMLDICGNRGWRKVNCSTFFGEAPFVQHVRGPGGAYCKEELVQNNRIVDTFIRSAQGIPIC